MHGRPWRHRKCSKIRWVDIHKYILAKLLFKPLMLPIRLSSQFQDNKKPAKRTYFTPNQPPIPIQTLPLIPVESSHPFHLKPDQPFRSKVGHAFQRKPATQAGSFFELQVLRSSLIFVPAVYASTPPSVQDGANH